MKQVTIVEAEKLAEEFRSVTGSSPAKTMDELRQELRHSAHVAKLEDEIDNLRRELESLRGKYKSDAIDSHSEK